MSPSRRDAAKGTSPRTETVPFVFEDFRGEVAAACVPNPALTGGEDRLAAEIRRLADPSAALETVHWDRNYLYRATFVPATEEGADEPLDVVVKQFRNQGWKRRLDRRLRGSKAERSFRMARHFEAAGIPTAEPVLLIESTAPEGPSFFVTRHLGNTLEARHIFRARNAGRLAEEFPDLDYEAFLDRLGRLLRRMHEAELFHRDLSIGNVLIDLDDPERLIVIDLNRGRKKKRLALTTRTRDLCRLAIFRRADQERFLEAYWGGPPGFSRRAVYLLYHKGFLAKIEGKKKIRRFFRRFRDWLIPRKAHPHIPQAPTGAGARDKIVWDHLSDQPHQHAGRFEKLAVRLADLPSHGRQTVAILTALPRVLRRYRALRRELDRRPVRFDGVGVALRPWPKNPEALLEAVDDLGVDKALLRLHPWADDDRDELELARELHARGIELAFALPQNRDLVRDPGRWRARVEELAETFTPYGCHFQVGQAVNRSKWGIWTYEEYARLVDVAADVLRRHAGVELLGPAVIDFELHATVAALNACRDVGFDVLASLLYVDRRGAPENTQLGFDTVGKVVLLQAIAETSAGVAPRSWITEVNWPLWEGPHSPAGKSVSVSEEVQADYLARFYLLALTTGLVERVYWWQVVARGYGLIAPGDDGAPLRRRPSFAALATLGRELDGAELLGRLEAPPGAHLFHFRRPDGGETVAGWSAGEPCRGRLPRPAAVVITPDGTPGAIPPDGGGSAAGVPEIALGASVCYVRLEGSGREDDARRRRGGSGSVKGRST